jgi:ATP-dependent DNA helicase RecQ
MLSQAKTDAFESFAQGCSVQEVATKIGRAESTTSGYLGEFIRAKGITDPSPWVNSDDIASIKSAASEAGSLERLAPIKEKLGDDFTYEQIRVVIDCLKVETGFE